MPGMMSPVRARAPAAARVGHARCRGSQVLTPALRLPAPSIRALVAARVGNARCRRAWALTLALLLPVPFT